MLEGIKVLCHSSIKISKKEVIYFDPFKINKQYNDADIIFITHSHYDHFSEEDINKVRKENTIICVPKDLEEKVLSIGFKIENILIVEPDKKYQVKNINFETISAYNNFKQFHPKSNEWVGYIIEIEDLKYYIAGDTDLTEDNKKVKCDVAFVPIGGKYTMNSEEAAELINIIKPKVAVPIHYGCIIGTNEDAQSFKAKLDKNIDCEILIK